MVMSTVSEPRVFKRRRWTTERAECLAPLERQTHKMPAVDPEVVEGEDEGCLRLDTGEFAVPEGMLEDADPSPWWILQPVATVIVVISLLFVAFVGWEIRTKSEWREGEGWKIRLEAP
jgi:hypothetical protein